ncbi:MAG: hypothetical protein QXO76_05425, partial [Thermoproteota archaeon]
SGGYTLRVTHGPKQVETQVRAEQEDTRTTVTLPIAFVFLNQSVSLSDTYMVVAALTALITVTAALVILPRIRGKLAFKY